MDTAERVARVVRHTEEVLTADEVRALFERAERPRAYIGFEPSGALTVAHLITARKILDLAEAGCDVTVFLADWHAWINDKLGGDLERIRASGRYMRAAFTALGADPDRVRYRFASDLVGSSDYWARVVRVAKATTLARTKRAMSIMGRSEEESNLDSSKLFYPAMQAADIFELPVDLAYGGMDQRRAHVLAREVAHHYGWPVPAAVHTPLLSSLKGGTRMNPVEGILEGKMSKSDPTTAVALPSERSEVESRLAGAFCPAKEVDGNPVVEIVRYIVFPWEGRLGIVRPPKYGGPLTYESTDTFLDAWRNGAIHPADLKAAVAAALDRRIEPVREHFHRHPEDAPASFLAAPPPGRGPSSPGPAGPG
jgi:tyrosyl-tRNA synthetase